MLLTVAIGLIGIFHHCSASDPCTSPKSLPRTAYRGGKCTYNQQKPICDQDLAMGWYRADVNDKDLLIQRVPARFSTCGTKFPWWMNGSLPMKSDDEVSRTLCQTNLNSNCSETSNVTIKQCGSYYVYKLHPTKNCDAGYCFGENEDCPPFDPCDFYEHQEVTFDADKPTICSRADKCATFDASDWFYFKGKDISQVFNQSQLSLDFSTCKTDKYAVIEGASQSLPNGTMSHTVCIRGDGAECKERVTLLSRQCKGFFEDYQVYKLPSVLKSTCNRLCIDTEGLDKKWFSCHDVFLPTTPTSTVADIVSVPTVWDNATVGGNNSAVSTTSFTCYTIGFTTLYILNTNLI